MGVLFRKVQILNKLIVKKDQQIQDINASLTAMDKNISTVYRAVQIMKAEHKAFRARADKFMKG